MLICCIVISILKIFCVKIELTAVKMFNINNKPSQSVGFIQIINEDSRYNQIIINVI